VDLRQSLLVGTLCPGIRGCVDRTVDEPVPSGAARGATCGTGVASPETLSDAATELGTVSGGLGFPIP
jgi:hypothetical protein